MTRLSQHMTFKVAVAALGISSMVALTAHAKPAMPTNAQVVKAVTRYIENPANLRDNLGHPTKSPKIIHIERSIGSKMFPACTYKSENGTYNCWVHITWQYPNELKYHDTNKWTFRSDGNGWRVIKTGWGHTLPADLLGS